MFRLLLAALYILIRISSSQKTTCGSNTWCYYENIYPSSTTPTTHAVTIQNIDDSAATYFNIYFTPINDACRDPSVSFIFEEIDFFSTAEFLSVYNGTYGTNLLSTCTGTKDKGCNNWILCFNNTDLGISSFNSQYQLTVYEPAGINDLCTEYHSYSINAILTLHCGGYIPPPTPSPTSVPTSAPSSVTSSPSTIPTSSPTSVTSSPTTTPTSSPTSIPTLSPTSPTSIPTSSPTSFPTATPTKAGQKILCGTYTYCYNLDIYPSSTTETLHTISIQNRDENAATYFEIYFTPITNACRDPSITFIFEEIDFQITYTEYLKVYDGVYPRNVIKTCHGTQDGNCYNWLTCLDFYQLGISSIPVDSTRQITIYEPSSIDALCTPYHSYSINANLTLHCGGTAAPTLTPTTSTKTSCGTNTYCYYEDVYTSYNTATTHTVSIQNRDLNAATIFNLYFTPQTYSCRYPSISFSFEEIDFGQTASEYLRVYKLGTSSYVTTLKTCYGTHSNCSHFIDCLSDYYLGITSISAGSTYGFQVYESSGINALCRSYHSYSINARFTLHCGGSPPTTTTSRSPTPTAYSSRLTRDSGSGLSTGSATIIIVSLLSVCACVLCELCRRKNVKDQQKRVQIAQSIESNDNEMKKKQQRAQIAQRNNYNVASNPAGAIAISSGAGINNEGALPVGWRKAYTNTGQVYYQNDITKKTQWMRPVSNDNVEMAPPPMAFGAVTIAERNNDENEERNDNNNNDVQIATLLSVIPGANMEALSCPYYDDKKPNIADDDDYNDDDNNNNNIDISRASISALIPGANDEAPTYPQDDVPGAAGYDIADDAPPGHEDTASSSYEDVAPPSYPDEAVPLCEECRSSII